MIDIPPIQTELLVGVGVPAVAALVTIVSYFWKKSKCFVILKNKVENLDQEIKNFKDEVKKARDTHLEIFDRLNQIDKHLGTVEGKLDMLTALKK